jgi:hypothetical protein
MKTVKTYADLKRVKHIFTEWDVRRLIIAKLKSDGLWWDDANRTTHEFWRDDDEKFVFEIVQEQEEAVEIVKGNGE